MGGFENLRSSETGGSSSGVAGSIQFSDGASGFSSDGANFFYDDTNNRLGIGTNTPGAPLHIVGRTYQTGLGDSTFFGFEAGLNDDLTNNINTAFGYQAMRTNTTGYQNLAMGGNSLLFNTTGYQNVAMGYYSLGANTTGYRNTAIGVQSLFSNTTGNNNVAIGKISLYANTTGTQNIAIGSDSLPLNITGYDNIAIGGISLFNNTTGYQNVAIGGLAGSYTSTFTDNNTSNNSVYLGYDSKSGASGNTNEIVIGYSASGVGSNSVVLGNDSITKTILKGNIGLGTTTPNSKLQINGSLAIKRTATAVSVSSASEVIIAVTDTSTTRTITLSTSDMVDGRIMIIKDESGGAGTNNITIDTQGSELIDGVVNVAITTNYGVIRLYSNGTNRFSF